LGYFIYIYFIIFIYILAYFSSNHLVPGIKGKAR